MSNTPINIALFLLSTASAAITVSVAGVQALRLEQDQSATAIGTRGAKAFEHLSMGPDPGGKTGDTVTPATTKTGQPSYDEKAAPNQSGPSSTGAPAVASDRAVPTTGPTTSSVPAKQ